MNGRFRFAETLKHRLRAIATRRRQVRMIDQVKNLGQAPMRMGMGVRRNVLAMIMNVLGVIVNVLGGSCNVRVDRELRRRHTGSQHAIGVDVRVAEREAAERLAQIVERQAGVEQRAERHVAGDAGETIEIQDSRH
jgi:hypothetical protein